MRDWTDKIHHGDALHVLHRMPDAFVQTVVTSPPYWGLRDYGVAGQMGLERTPEEYVTHMVEVFREVRRVLRNDGTLWLNIGDSFSHGGCGARDIEQWPKQSRNDHQPKQHGKVHTGLKPKDLVGIPWRLALALQADGWWLRSDIIWHKPNPMPESVMDRPTKAHEYVFLLTRSAKYFYDVGAVKEPVTGNSHARGNGVNPKAVSSSSAFRVDRTPANNNRSRVRQNESFSAAVTGLVSSRNLRDVWTIATRGNSDTHFATFPEKLVEPCILAGTSEHGACTNCGTPWERLDEADIEYNRWKAVGWRPMCKHEEAPVTPCVVLDPFAGTGTALRVAQRLGRRWIGIELNPKYIDMAMPRLAQGVLL